MNEEYLWNKTGSDPDIEHLEKALAIFRHRESAKPPVFAVVEDAKPAPRWRFPLAFAFAACAAVVFGAVILLQLSKVGSSNDDMVTYVANPIVEEAAPKPETAPSAMPRPASPSPRRVKQKIESTVAKAVRRPKQIHRDNRAPQGIASLTKEERYAYDQLMLALSITSSKLKIVQDTINGTEPENTNER